MTVALKCIVEEAVSSKIDATNTIIQAILNICIVRDSAL